MDRVRKSITGASILALVLSVSTASVFTLSATAAFAERGGSSNGRSNRNRDRNENARGPSERGLLARELRGLNAAHANQNALENASSDSMTGKLYIYQQASQALSTATTANADYQKIVDDGADNYVQPEGGPTFAEVVEAGAPYTVDQIGLLQTDVSDALIALDAEDLSDGALAELNRLLGL